MKQDEEEDQIICICSKENSAHTIGIRVPCRGPGCNAQLWLSDSTINRIKKEKTDVDLTKTPPTPLCMDCGLKALKNSKDFKIAPPTTEQMEEILKAMTEIDAQQR